MAANPGAFADLTRRVTEHRLPQINKRQFLNCLQSLVRSSGGGYPLWEREIQSLQNAHDSVINEYEAIDGFVVYFFFMWMIRMLERSRLVLSQSPFEAAAYDVGNSLLSMATSLNLPNSLRESIEAANNRNGDLRRVVQCHDISLIIRLVAFSN